MTPWARFLVNLLRPVFPNLFGTNAHSICQKEQKAHHTTKIKLCASHQLTSNRGGVGNTVLEHWPSLLFYHKTGNWTGCFLAILCLFYWSQEWKKVLKKDQQGCYLVQWIETTVFSSLRWLCNESLPATSRRWSVEGLAYLTFDADVKEDLVQDKNALLAMCDLAKVWCFFLN